MITNIMFVDFKFLYFLYYLSNLLDLLSSFNIIIFISSILLLSLPLIYLSGNIDRVVKGIFTGIGIGIGKLAVDTVASGSNTSGDSTKNNGGSSNTNSTGGKSDSGSSSGGSDNTNSGGSNDSSKSS